MPEESEAPATEKPPAPLDGAGLTQLLVLACIWGSSFLFIKVSLQGLSPGQIVLLRMLLGAGILGVIALVRRRPLPRHWSVWGHLLMVSLLLNDVPFLLYAWAEQHVSSALASIYNAATPLLTLPVAFVALPSDPPTRQRLLGVGLGFLGVILILGPWSAFGSQNELLGQIACLAAAGCYGLGYVYHRRFLAGHRYDATTLAFGQVAAGALALLPASPWILGSPIMLSGAVVLCMLCLGLGGTGVAYILNTVLIQRYGATVASTVTYVLPLVSVLLGVLVLGESITWNQPAGGLVVLASIALAQGHLARPGTRPAN